MKYQCAAILITFSCIARCEVVIDFKNLTRNFRENNIEEIYKSSSQIKNIDQKKIKLESELYKNIYALAAMRFNDAHDYTKVYETVLDTLGSEAFNSDEKYIREMTIYALKAFDNNTSCTQKSGFILKALNNGVLESKKTYYLGEVIIKEFLRSTVPEYEKNASCIIEFNKLIYNTQLEKYKKNKKYKSTTAVAVAALIFESIEELNPEVKKQELIILMNDYFVKLLANRRDLQAYQFITSVVDFIHPVNLEQILIFSEKNIVALKDYEDEINFHKLTLLGTYLPSYKWPFVSSRDRLINNLIDLKISQIGYKDLFLAVASGPIIRHLKSLSNKEAAKLYKKIVDINHSNIRNLGVGPDLQEAFQFLIAGFQMRAALSMGDLQTAQRIHDQSYGGLILFFSNENRINNKNYKYSSKLMSILRPYLEYEIFLGRSDAAKEIIDIAVPIQEIDLAQIGSRAYLLENKRKFISDNKTFLYLLKDYYKFSGDKRKLAEVRLATTVLVPGSYNDVEDYFIGIADSINDEDLEAYNFYTSIFKDNLFYYRQDDTYPIWLGLDEALKDGLNTFPNELDSYQSKLEWKKIQFEKFYEYFGLFYFLNNHVDGYTDKISALRALYSLARKLDRKEEAYVYANMYLDQIKWGGNLIKESTLLSDFRQSQLEQIEEIIQFFMEGGKLIDAKNAISVFKEQRFLDFLGVPERLTRSPDPNPGGLNDAALTLKIKAKSAELGLVKQGIDSARTQENLEKLKKLKESLTTELISLYKTKSKVIAWSENLEKSNSLPFNGRAYVDYFIKNNRIYIVYTDSGNLVKIEKEIDIKYFSKLVNDLKPSFAENNVDSLRASSLILYDYLFSSIEELLVRNKISSLYIRANSFIASVPLKYVVSSKGGVLDHLNILYRGVGNSETSGFTFNEKSSLFATTKSFEKLPALSATGTEVDYIFNSYKTRFLSKSGSRKFLNQAFSLRNLTSEFASTVNVIHIASHFSNDGNSGGLLFGAGGLVSVQRIWKELTPSPTGKLVTISACDSGLFRDQGQSMEDLPNVFLGKGATFVVATLWKISDSATADFMRLFYDILIISEDPPTALNLTQSSFADGDFSKLEAKFFISGDFKLKHLSSIKKYSNPFFWAGFQLVSSL